jgi:hypothetical protein
MDIEQLKLILEMVGAAGEGAKDLALLFMAVGFAKGLVTPAATVVIGVVAARLIRHCVDACNAAEIDKEIAVLEWHRKKYPADARENTERALANAGE